MSDAEINTPVGRIAAELRERAAAVADNVAHPGEPTITGWLTVLLEEVTSLRARLDRQEDEAHHRALEEREQEDV